ncbi:hypothetical protein B0A71_21410 [Flavobacterium tructae]|uniref:Uncharacterized protein n=1 Tax=Flavobacterium tructae TaxID=1114873 RepID=A0A1S1J2N6_9FLAO|nr:hypothetical protein BHE19_09205 [Flavobacterium tructae]OXB14623.1 hypothetical protein B0A71_21410 [Flavobacterium tructae]
MIKIIENYFFLFDNEILSLICSLLFWTILPNLDHSALHYAVAKAHSEQQLTILPTKLETEA